MFKTRDVNEAVALFTNVFKSVLDTHAPIKTVQHHKNYAPYLSQELKEKMKFRDLLKKSWHFTGDEETLKEYKNLEMIFVQRIK